MRDITEPIIFSPFMTQQQIRSRPSVSLSNPEAHRQHDYFNDSFKNHNKNDKSSHYLTMFASDWDIPC